MEKTLIKGLAVLESLVQQGGPSGVSDLAASLKLSKSNAHRLLNTLVDAGFVVVSDGRYSASLKLWELGTRVISRYDVRKFARPAMQRLAHMTDEGVRLTTFDPERFEVVYIDSIDSQQAVRTFTEVGGRAPVHCTSSGKVLLAYQTADMIRRATKKLKRYTEATITKPAELVRHLEKVRRDGYALNQREYSDQVRGVAAPVFGWDGTVIAALSIAAPAERLSQSVLRRYIAVICECAADVSAEMRVASTGAPDLPRPRMASGHKEGLKRLQLVRDAAAWQRDAKMAREA